MPRRQLNIDVIESSVERLAVLYREGHRLVISSSGGKDSTCTMEIAIMAARQEGCLPIDVVHRDEEVIFPGTSEYLDRVWERTDEVRLHHLVANQPIVNVCNRANPYFWVFDPELDPSQWVRQPPAHAIYITDLNIQAMTTPERFPHAEGKRLFSVYGLRTQESPNRRMAIHSSKGYVTKHPTKRGAYGCRPIYDWTEGDVWKAIKDFKWDHNDAYNVMYRVGWPRNRMRVGPPTMLPATVEQLPYAKRSWPRWFDKVCKRLPGVRTGGQFGRRAVVPNRRLGESWEQCYQRTCIDEAPEWIRDRATSFKDGKVKGHAAHSTAPFPESTPCHPCGQVNTWRTATGVMYNGDPFVSQATSSPLKCVEPEFFRAGSGTWGAGTPAF